MAEKLNNFCNILFQCCMQNYIFQNEHLCIEIQFLFDFYNEKFDHYIFLI